MLITVAIPHPAALEPTPRLAWEFRHVLKLRRRNVGARLRADELRYIDELVQRWSPEWKVPPGETDAVKRSLREPGSLEAAIGYYRALARSPSISSCGVSALRSRWRRLGRIGSIPTGVRLTTPTHSGCESSAASESTSDDSETPAASKARVGWGVWARVAARTALNASSN